MQPGKMSLKGWY